MKDKYTMTREYAALYARRNLVGYVWESANLEGISVTFPETTAILENATAAGKKPFEIVAILNLKHAWQFILDSDTLDCTPDLKLVMEVNRRLGTTIVMNAGYLRTFPVQISGTSWKPEMPNQEVATQDIQDILVVPNVTERALRMFLYLARAQLFFDGNKRTATLVANQILIAGGKGCFQIPIACQQEFCKLLVEFYESNQPETIMEFMYENCLDGFDVPAEQTHRFSSK